MHIAGLYCNRYKATSRHMAMHTPILLSANIPGDGTFDTAWSAQASKGDSHYDLCFTGMPNMLAVYCSCPHFKIIPKQEQAYREPPQVCKHLKSALDSVAVDDETVPDNEESAGTWSSAYNPENMKFEYKYSFESVEDTLEKDLSAMRNKNKLYGIPKWEELEPYFHDEDSFVEYCIQEFPRILKMPTHCPQCDQELNPPDLKNFRLRCYKCASDPRFNKKECIGQSLRTVSSMEHMVENTKSCSSSTTGWPVTPTHSLVSSQDGPLTRLTSGPELHRIFFAQSSCMTTKQLVVRMLLWRSTSPNLVSLRHESNKYIFFFFFPSCLFFYTLLRQKEIQ